MGERKSSEREGVVQMSCRLITQDFLPDNKAQASLQKIRRVFVWAAACLMTKHDEIGTAETTSTCSLLPAPSPNVNTHTHGTIQLT